MKRNRLLECPKCEEPTLTVLGSDSDENNVGTRRYQCSVCRGRFTTLEVFFTDDKGDPDFFNQIALNQRLYNREKYQRTSNPVRAGVRPLKATDEIRVLSSPGKVILTYKRNPRIRQTWAECINGHPFNKENTYTKPDGIKRTCKICRDASHRRYVERSRVKIREQQARYRKSHPEQIRAKERAYRARKRAERLLTA